MSTLSILNRQTTVLKKSLLLSIMAAFIWSGNVLAADTDPSRASSVLPTLSGIVLVDSLSLVVTSGVLAVKSVEAVADGVVIVFKGASEAATASVKLTGQAAHGVSLAVGSAVEVVVVSTGSLLVASGKAIAFIPNEVGQSLLYQSRVSS